jgi:signal transduction histidine kinase
VIPIVVTVAGLSLIFGPWLWRLAQQLSDERRERIRSEERSEMAAHLHDSVLQTLALIQRTEDPQKMASLARVQERELRAWLFGQSGDAAADLLSTAIDTLASKVESLHHVPVEAVVVGDRPMDDRLTAMVHAGAEAMVNAAKHSGASSVSVYVEVEDEAITAFVRDSGKGFDPNDVPANSNGIAESIRSRMERNGGTAEIVSAPGDGTEVRLRLPR